MSPRDSFSGSQTVSPAVSPTLQIRSNPAGGECRATATLARPPHLTAKPRSALGITRAVAARRRTRPRPGRWLGALVPTRAGTAGRRSPVGRFSTPVGSRPPPAFHGLKRSASASGGSAFPTRSSATGRKRPHASATARSNTRARVAAAASRRSSSLPPSRRGDSGRGWASTRNIPVPHGTKATSCRDAAGRRAPARRGDARPERRSRSPSAGRSSNPAWPLRAVGRVDLRRSQSPSSDGSTAGESDGA